MLGWNNQKRKQAALRVAGWLLVILLGAGWTPAAATAFPVSAPSYTWRLLAADSIPRDAWGDSDVLPLKLSAGEGSFVWNAQGESDTACFLSADGKAEETETLPVFLERHWKILTFTLCTLFALLAALLLSIRRKRRLLAELSERDHQLSDLMDLLPGGVCIFTADRAGHPRADYLNPGLYRMLGDNGSAGEKLVHQNMADWVHPKDRSGMLAELVRCQRDDDEYCNTFRLQKKDGSYFWVTLRGAPVKKMDGRLVYYGIFTNVDVIMEMREQLEESEESMRAAMNQAGMNYWEYDPEHHLVHYDRNTQQMLNVPEWMEDYPASWFKMGITHPKDVPALERALREIDAGAAEAVCEIRERTVEGIYRWERVCLIGLYDWKGKRTKVLGTGIDITQQKNNELFYEQRLAQLRAATPDLHSFFRLDLTQNLCLESITNFPELSTGVTADEFFEEMASFSVTEQEKKSCRLLFNRSHLMEVFESGRQIEITERRYREGGEVHWAALRTHLDRNPANSHVEALIYSLNIDERKWVQQITCSVLRNQYLLFMRIDLSHNTIRLYNAHTGHFLKEHDCSPETIVRCVRRRCADSDVEEIVKKVSFPEVKRQLQNSDEYVVYGNLKLNGRQMRVKCVYSWMDREQRTVCLALSDITDASL